MKILIIRFRRVGDSVLSSTLCTSLKRSIPNSEIHYILNDNIAPLFQYHPDIDKIITFTKEETDNIFLYLSKVRKIMTKNNYNIVIDTRTTFKTIFFPLFSLKSKYRIGRKKPYRNIIYNKRVQNEYKENRDKDNVQLTLKLLDPLDKEFKVIKDPIFKLYYSPKEVSDFKIYMESKGIDFSKPIITCAIATRLEHKAWPTDKMSEVLDRIIKKYDDVQLIFNYGDDREKYIVKEIHKNSGYIKNIFTNIEANNLRELIAMLVNSSFFFGNEGGVRHIAHALNVPSFAIYSPDTPLTCWLPNKSEHHQGIELADINKKEDNNHQLTYQQRLNLIDVESVWNRLDKMLATYINKQKTHKLT